MDGPAKTFFKQTFETETDENAARAAPDQLPNRQVLARAIQLTIMEYFGDHPLDAYNNQLNYLNSILMANNDSQHVGNRVDEISKKNGLLSI